MLTAAVLLAHAGAARADAAPGAPAAKERPLSEAIEAEDSACFDRESVARGIAHWLRTERLDARLSIKLRKSESTSPQGESFVLLREGVVVVERELPHRNVPCEELRSAISLAIAIAVETTLVDAEQVRPVEPVVEAPPIPDRPPEDAQPRQQTRSISSEAAAHVFVGLLPRPTWGAQASLMIPLTGPLDLRAGVFFAAPQAISIGQGEGDFSLWAGNLQGCFAKRGKSTELDLCAGGAVGRLAAQGRGYVVSLSPGLPWAAVLATARARMSLTQLVGATLAVGGFLPVARPELDVRTADNELVASRALPLAGGSIGIGVDVRFW